MASSFAIILLVDNISSRPIISGDKNKLPSIWVLYGTAKILQLLLHRVLLLTFLSLSIHISSIRNKMFFQHASLSGR